MAGGDGRRRAGRNKRTGQMPALQGEGFDGEDGREEAGDDGPRTAFVARGEELAALRAEVEASGVGGVGGHGGAKNERVGVTGGQTASLLLPGTTAGGGAVDGEAAVGRGALVGADEREDQRVFGSRGWTAMGKPKREGRPREMSVQESPAVSLR